MKLLQKDRQKKAGLTFVELLLAVFLLSLGIVGTLLLFSNSILSSEYAWDMSVATTHADSLLEEMQGRSSLNEITSTDWAQWVTDHQLNTLPAESVEIKFDDPPGDPLDIVVNVHWSRHGKINKLSFKTKMTK